MSSVHPLLLMLPAFSLPSLWTGARSRRIVQQSREASAGQGRLLDHFLALSSGVAGGAEARIFGIGREISDRARAMWDDRAEAIARAQLRDDRQGRHGPGPLGRSPFRERLTSRRPGTDGCRPFALSFTSG